MSTDDPAVVALTTFAAGWEAAMVFAQYPRSQDERDWDSHDVRTAYAALAAAGVVSGVAASKAEHHPNCYQVTAIPEDLPDDLCDCRVLRMIDAHAVAASKADTDEEKS